VGCAGGALKGEGGKKVGEGKPFGELLRLKRKQGRFMVGWWLPGGTSRGVLEAKNDGGNLGTPTK